MYLNQKGQALVEYVLIIALVVLLIIGLVNTLGGYLKDSMTKSSCSISGMEYVKGDSPGKGTCQEKKSEE